MDKFHVRQKKFGAHLYLMQPLLDADRIENLTTLFLQLLESRSFLLFRVTENTQNQSARGREELNVIH